MQVEEARRVLIGLLTDATARETLRRGELDPVFDTIDLEQLDRSAVLIRRDVLKRQRRGAPPLLEQFAATLADRDADEVAEEFVRSRHFADYRELPHGAPGLCIEEAFFRFLGQADIGQAEIRRMEYLRAAAQALVVHPHPAFTVPRPFLSAGGGWVAIDDGPDAPTMYAAVGGRFIQGVIPRIVVLALQTNGKHPDAEEATRRLEALGFSFG